MITIDQILLLSGLTFLLSGTLTPLMRILALKLNFVDRPDAAHKSHSEAIPYMGGVAIVLSILAVTYSAIFFQENLRNNFWIATSLLGPSVFLAIVGLIDDRKRLDPLPRFIAQSIAGIFTAGVIIQSDTVGSPTGNSILDASITIFWIVGISNSINFFDNLDGGAAGTVAVAAFGIFWIAYLNDQFLIAASAITIFGAMLGFLIWNRSPARIYMGDAGALFLGTLLASLSVRLDINSESLMVSFAVVLLLVAVPILDTTVAVVSRIRRGKSIFIGGKDHLSHRLLRHGFSKRKTVFMLWTLAAFFSLISVALAMEEKSSLILIYLATTGWFVLLVMFLREEDE